MASTRLRRRRSRRFPNRLLLIGIAVFGLLFMRAIPTPEDSLKAPLALVPQPEETLLTVYDVSASSVRSIALEEYIRYVVAAEMPASYHAEALRAQAVASRSYTVFRLRSRGGTGCVSHPEADVCTDSACCQACLPLGQADSIDPSVSAAVAATRGQILVCNGSVINALYHASSGGRTENVESVFSQALPYLRSVDSPGEESYPQYASERRFTRQELSALFPLNAEKPLSEQLSVLDADSTGRAITIQAGEKQYPAASFRRLLGLASTWMSFSFEKDAVCIATRGYGHGVGMSQTGADAMAARGAQYQDILSWYYTGCELAAP